MMFKEGWFFFSPPKGFGLRFMNYRRVRNLGHLAKWKSQEWRSVSDPFCSRKSSDSHMLHQVTDVCVCLTFDKCSPHT